MDLSRRDLFGSILGLGGTLALAGCSDQREDPPREESPPQDPTPTPPSESADEPPAVPDGFSRVVDVTEMGADPTGEESLIPVLDDIDPEGTLIFVPPGRYRMDGNWTVEGFERTGIFASEATIVPDPGLDVHLFSFNGREYCRELRIDGLSFDYTYPEASGRMIHAEVRDGLQVRDITARGTVDRRPSLVRVDVTDPDGSGVIERLILPNGATAGSGVTGCYVGNNSRGTLTFRDCHIEGFPDNGLYADPPAGRIIVEGGQFINNGISNVRIRGNSVVRDVYVRCDTRHRDFDNMRGIRLTDYEPQSEDEPAVVENCRIEMLDVTYSDGAIVLSSQLASGIVRDTTITVDADDVQAIRVKSPDGALGEFDVTPRIRLDGVTVDGDASGGEAMYISGRDDGVFEDIDIYQPGSNRDGIVFNRSNGNHLQDGRIRVSGDPLVLVESTVDYHGIERQTLGPEQY